jgi:tripartite-type tricarboxylate transporter receptor subunit TctC
MSNRRKFVQSIVGASLLSNITALRAQVNNWPESTTKIIVPFSAGGASDILTRVIAEKLQSKFNQNFVVENKTGAGGNIGMEAVKNAAPDGYTIASATIGTLSINQYLFSKMNYDPVNDFVYSTTIWENCNVFVVSNQNPARSVQEFLSWAKRQPNGVNYGSAGVGTTPHLAGALFAVRTGLKAQHIPYRGAAQSMPALMSGETHYAIDNIASYLPLIKAGKVKALAVSSIDRWPTLPDIPTLTEQGIKDFIITSWGAFVLPKATPISIANKISQAVSAISQESALQQRFLDTGARSVSSTPQELMAFADKERTKWKEMVQVSGATMD